MMSTEKNFKTPIDLWNKFQEYKLWAHEHPWIKETASKGEVVELRHERPLTMYEFASYCEMSYQGLRNYALREDHSEYFGVYARIENEIMSFQVSGGLCDIYNASLTARINGISDKREIDASVTQKDEVDLTKLSDGEIDELSKLMEKMK
jgi:hypothetical protein